MLDVFLLVGMITESELANCPRFTSGTRSTRGPLKPGDMLTGLHDKATPRLP